MTKTKTENKNNTNSFQEQKELKCILKIEENLKDFDIDLKIILKNLIDIIPTGWSKPKSCKVSISIGDIKLESEGYKETSKKLNADISIDNKKYGNITICCIDSKSENDFSDSEQNLFKLIVYRIEHFINYVNLKESLSIGNSSKVQTTNIDDEFNKWLTSLGLSKKEIELVTKVPINFKKSENICKQGSLASFVMILKSGLIKASIENSNYRNHVFKITKPFSIIGLSSLYANEYYHFSAKAIVPSTVFLIERNVFKKIIKTNKKFSAEIMEKYCESLQTVYNKLGSIVNKQALGKVCDALIYLSNVVFESNYIDNSISRKDMAEFAGMSTENFVRILSELKNDNIITIHPKSIEINNFERLKMLSNLG